jgi:large conductance mechanosensitive channel
LDAVFFSAESGSGLTLLAVTHRLRVRAARLRRKLAKPHCKIRKKHQSHTPQGSERGITMGMMSEFKEFAVKGNVMDLAVGVIIGAAFGKIVDSVVGDLIMPLIGKIVGGLDFSNMYIALNNQAAGLTLVEAKKLGAVFAYGNFITVVLNFAILAFIVFLMVKQMNKLKNAAPPPAPAATPEDVLLLREIRDSLKK